jgi:hypothetical protein
MQTFIQTSSQDLSLVKTLASQDFERGSMLFFFACDNGVTSNLQVLHSRPELLNTHTVKPTVLFDVGMP